MPANLAILRPVCEKQVPLLKYSEISIDEILGACI